MLLTHAQQQQILETASQHGARSVRVFGSRARGDATDASDLDLLVEMERGRSLLDLVELEQELEALLGMRVDVLTPGSLSPYIREAVERDAVVL